MYVRYSVANRVPVNWLGSCPLFCLSMGVFEKNSWHWVLHHRELLFGGMEGYGIGEVWNLEGGVTTRKCDFLKK